LKLSIFRNGGSLPPLPTAFYSSIFCSLWSQSDRNCCFSNRKKGIKQKEGCGGAEGRAAWGRGNVAKIGEKEEENYGGGVGGFEGGGGRI
jgi:hypothetical protein